MSNKSNNLVGSIIWMDLTVQHAVDIKNFYRKAIGWEMTEVNIGEYSDYSMVEHPREKPLRESAMHVDRMPTSSSMAGLYYCCRH